MSTSYEHLLLKTLENYRIGCQKPVIAPLKTSGEYIDEILHYFLQMQMENSLSNTDQFLLRWSANIRAQGLIATRSEEFIEAEKFFTKARTYYESGSLSSQASLLYKSFQEPAEALLDYRRGDFEQASFRISEALRSDVILEDEYGYDILFIHRIHLVLNLIRIEVRSQRFHQAIELACQLLNYLQGISEDLPLPFPWGYERVVLLPEDVLVFMFTQVIDEIAFILAGKNYQLARELFANVLHHLQFQNEDNFVLFPQVREWLIVKQTFVDGDIAAFLEQASRFFAQGRNDNILLWYAVTIDLLALCDECKFLDSAIVKQEIVTEALNFQYFPQKFFSLLRNYANFDKGIAYTACV